MRITGGRFARHAITAPKGDTTRPATDRTREALFNMLSHGQFAGVLDGAHVLDLFAGSGSYGLEAISRGAKMCLFVDTSSAARGAIRENIDALNLFGQCRLHRRSATSLGPRPTSFPETFNLVFLDPPYERGLGEDALAGLVDTGWITQDSLIIYECAKREEPTLPDYQVLDTRTWGAAKVLILRLAD